MRWRSTGANWTGMRTTPAFMNGWLRFSTKTIWAIKWSRCISGRWRNFRILRGPTSSRAGICANSAPAVTPTLTRQVVDTFSGTEVDRYFREVGTARAIDAPLYLQLNLYAHERFPNDLTFVHNLLGAYSREGTANAAAHQALLRQYWFYDDRFCGRSCSEDLARSGNLEAEIAAARGETKSSRRGSGCGAIRGGRRSVAVAL